MSVQHFYECIIINPTGIRMKSRGAAPLELWLTPHKIVAENVDLDPGWKIKFQRTSRIPGIGLLRVVCQHSLKFRNAVVREARR